MATLADDSYVPERQAGIDYALFDAAIDEVFTHCKKMGIPIRHRSTIYLVWEALHPGQRMDILLGVDSMPLIRWATMMKISERISTRRDPKDKKRRAFIRLRNWSTTPDLSNDMLKRLRSRKAVDIIEFMNAAREEIRLIEAQAKGRDASADPLRETLKYCLEKLHRIPGYEGYQIEQLQLPEPTVEEEDNDDE